MRSALAAGLAAALSAACTSTDQLGRGALYRLTGGGVAHRPLLLEDERGNRSRLDPGSRVRFRVGVEASEWISADELEVTSDGLLLHRGRALALERVDGLEVERFDGVKSYFLTAGIVVVAAALIAYAVGSGGGSSGSSEASTAESAPAPAPSFAGGVDVWVQFTGLGAPPVESVLGAPAEVRPLFSEGALRRATATGLVQLQLGQAFEAGGPRSWGLGVGVELFQAFEVSGGARVLERGEAREVLGYLRAGGSFPFTLDDTFGAPIALDVAVSQDGFRQMRVVWGARYRFEPFELAILPLNPELNRAGEEVFWRFPTSVLLGYRF